MSRPQDEALRTDLIERALDYLLDRGLSDFSLRPIADAIGSSPSLLLYHFGSKDGLLAEIIKAGRRRQQTLLAELDAAPGASDAETGRKLWRAWTSPKWEPLLRLFFETYALALQDRQRFPGFLEHAVGDWIEAIEPSRDPHARARATFILAAFRGLFLDFCATGDRKRVDRAFDYMPWEG